MCHTIRLTIYMACSRTKHVLKARKPALGCLNGATSREGLKTSLAHNGGIQARSLSRCFVTGYGVTASEQHCGRYSPSWKTSTQDQ